jgi:hypothetical protein
MSLIYEIKYPALLIESLHTHSLYRLITIIMICISRRWDVVVGVLLHFHWSGQLGGCGVEDGGRFDS